MVRIRRYLDSKAVVCSRKCLTWRPILSHQPSRAARKQKTRKDPSDLWCNLCCDSKIYSYTVFFMVYLFKSSLATLETWFHWLKLHTKKTGAILKGFFVTSCRKICLHQTVKFCSVKLMDIPLPGARLDVGRTLSSALIRPGVSQWPCDPVTLTTHHPCSCNSPIGLVCFKSENVTTSFLPWLAPRHSKSFNILSTKKLKFWTNVKYIKRRCMEVFSMWFRFKTGNSQADTLPLVFGSGKDSTLPAQNFTNWTA